MKTRFSSSGPKKLGNVAFKAGIGGAAKGPITNVKPIKQTKVTVNYEVPKPSGLPGKA